MHWHWQNLNNAVPPMRGGAFRHGRAWWYFETGQVRVEWSVQLRPSLALTVTEGNGERSRGLAFHVALFALHLWLAFEGFRWTPRGAGEYGSEERETGVSLSGEWLRLKWRCDFWEWPPRYGGEWSVSLLDTVLGRSVYSCRVLDTVATSIPMPEHSYPCTVKLGLAEWRRPRWPFVKRVRTAEVDIPDGVPHPGKGENSWDCGEDATYGMSCPARTVKEAVAAVVKSVLRSRRQYGGGVNWRPGVAP